MNQEKIWEAFQNDESLVDLGFPARRRFKFLAGKIPKGSDVLNIGVGNGYLEKLLVQKGVIVSCLDPSDAAINKIREQLELGDRAKSGYSQAIPFSDASFDFVIMSEVLEHLDDDITEKTLKEVKRVLKDKGLFIGTVPADENLKSGFVVCPKCGDVFHRWGHVKSFSEDSLSNILAREFTDVTVRRFVLSDFNQLNWKGKITAVLKELQAFLNLKGSVQNLFFSARKKK